MFEAREDHTLLGPLCGLILPCLLFSAYLRGWVKNKCWLKPSQFPGCITAEELKFVLTHIPDKRVSYKEIDEMIRTVDENGDGKINYQEFRVMIGAKPNLTAAMASSGAPAPKPKATPAAGERMK